MLGGSFQSRILGKEGVRVGLRFRILGLGLTVLGLGGSEGFQKVLPGFRTPNRGAVVSGEACRPAQPHLHWFPSVHTRPYTLPYSSLLQQPGPKKLKL